MATHYAVLGLTEEATEADIKTAYRTLAKTEHPDRHQNSPEATEKFKQIVHAYETLKDPEKRRTYDLFGDVGSDVLLDFGVDPMTRLKIWAGLVGIYIVLVAMGAYTGLALEWFLAIIAHGVFIVYQTKSLQKLDFAIWGATLVLYKILPSIIARKLAGFSFVLLASIVPNLAGIETDFTIVAMILGWSCEFWLRTAPVYWTITAAYSTCVSILVWFVIIAFFVEKRVPLLSDSYLIAEWNPIAWLSAVVFVVIWLLDALGGLLSPAWLVPWTFPLPWLGILLFVLVFVAFTLYVGSWRYLGGFIIAGVVGYFLFSLLPSKIVSFVISIVFHISFTSAIRSMELFFTTLYYKTAGPVLHYFVVAVFCIGLDWVTGHFSSLGGAHWERFGGFLMAESLLLLVGSFVLSEICVTVATEIRNKADDKPSGESAETNQEHDHAHHNAGHEDHSVSDDDDTGSLPDLEPRSGRTGQTFDFDEMEEVDTTKADSSQPRAHFSDREHDPYRKHTKQKRKKGTR